MPDAAVHRWVFWGGLCCALSVASGAFGAHSLASRLDAHSLQLWETAARYLMYGGLGQLAAGLLATWLPAAPASGLHSGPASGLPGGPTSSRPDGPESVLRSGPASGMPADPPRDLPVGPARGLPSGPPPGAPDSVLRRLAWAGGALLAGSVLFSVTVGALALGGPRWLGAITPLGGLLLIAGFLLLAAAGVTRRSHF